MRKCKYHSKCEYYDPEGTTCRKLGGYACGKKIELDYLRASKKRNLNVKKHVEVAPIPLT